MYSIEAIKSMEVIEINTGAKLGYIRDLKVDCEGYRIVSIVLPYLKGGLFTKRQDLEIPWENIKKIGLDVILVDAGNEMLQEELR